MSRGRATGAGRSPAGTGPWMARFGGAGSASAAAHGCAAAGPTRAMEAENAERAGVALAIPAGPLLLCPEGQTLPTAATVVHTQSRVGGGTPMKAHIAKLRIMSIMS